MELSALSSRSSRPLQHFKTFMFHSTARLLRGGKNNILILQIIHCCFQQ